MSSTIRPDYDTELYLTARDLMSEQRYRLQRLRHHNRFPHGWGVVCGLRVVPAADPARPWAILVCPGYAVDCCGDEILVAERAAIDIRDHLWARPDDDDGPAQVAIRYAWEPVRPVPVPPTTCGCEDTRYTPSRIHDGFRLDVLWGTSDSEQGAVSDLCEQPVTPCPDCADYIYLVLASVRLPASEGDPITAAHIDNLGH